MSCVISAVFGSLPVIQNANCPPYSVTELTCWESVSGWESPKHWQSLKLKTSAKYTIVFSLTPQEGQDY